MNGSKVFATVLFVFSMLMASAVFPTVNGSILQKSDARKFVESMNLANVAVLDAQATKLPTSNIEVIFVDGSWFGAQIQDAALIQDVKSMVHNRVPVIIVGGDESLIYRVAESRVRQNSNVTPQVQAVYFDGSKNCYLHVAGKSDMVSASQDAYKWSVEKLQAPSPQDLPPPQLPQFVLADASVSAASWVPIAQPTWSVTASPYGDLGVVEEWYKLQYDGSSTYDWYSLVMHTTSSPGCLVYPDIDTEWWPVTGNWWHTSGIWDQANVTYNGDPNTIITYGPTTTTGSSTFDVNIGVTAGQEGAGVSAGISYSYTYSDVQAYADNSQPGYIAWYHSVDPTKGVGAASCTVSPGFTVRTPPTGSGPGGEVSVTIAEAYGVQFAQPSFLWGWFIPDHSPIVSLGIATTIAYNWIPDTPLTPTGGPGPGIQGVKGVWYSFSTSATDADGNNVGYWFDWQDTSQTFTGWGQSGFTGSASHAWSSGGVFAVKVYAVESLTYLESFWSMYLSVTIEPTLTISASSGGANPPTNPAPSTNSYSYGSTVTVTAYPATGYYFDHWSLDGQTYSAYTTTTVTMEADHQLRANFYPNPTLTINSGTGGTTSPAAGTYSYNYGTYASVTATASPGYHFSYWSLDGTTYYSNPISVHMTSNHVLTPHYGSNGGGGGCPYVYSWNGLGFAKDNNVLPASEDGNGTDTKDYCRLGQQPVPIIVTRQTSSYAMQIREFEQEIDYFDQVKLIAVDHSKSTSIAVTPEGEILTYTDPASPISCNDNHGTNRLSEITSMNGNVNDPTTYFQGYEGDSLVLNFGKVTGPYAKLILRDDQKCADVCINVQVLDSTNQWQTVEVLHPRDYWSMEAANMAAYVSRTGDFIVRLLWTATHRLDYVGLDTSAPAQTTVRSANPTVAIHTTMGDVTAKLLYDDENCVKLVNGQQITLAFTLPNKVQGTTRDFIFYTNGYYYTITP